MSLSKIPLAGVIGSPIAHSKSPQLHRHWLETYGIAGHYVPLDVAPDDLEQVLRTLPKMGFVGVNLTIPHKEAVMKIADLITDRATLIIRMAMGSSKTSKPVRPIGIQNPDQRRSWVQAARRALWSRRFWTLACLRSACRTAPACGQSSCSAILAAGSKSSIGCRQAI
jgi:hypothetical protein